MLLVVVAWLTAPVFVALSLIRAAQIRNVTNADQSIFALRLGIVAVAWLVAIVDPTGGLAWLLD
jgi:hypothetical protein